MAIKVIKTVYCFAERRTLRSEAIFGNPLKMIKNDSYFTLDAPFFLKIFKFFSWRFDHVEKRLDWKDEVNFKIYDVATSERSNYNTHIVQYLKK